MPELPEVETIAKELNQELAGHVIESVRVTHQRTIDRPAYQIFEKRIRNQRVIKIDRRAKYLNFHLESMHLLVHLRMTGQFSLQSEVPEDKHTHVMFFLDDCRVCCYRDTRKFGRMYLVEDPLEIFNKIGPEPFDENLDSIFYSMLNSKKRSLKPLLLDQGFLAGLGNIYVDEALFEASLHPLRSSHSISEEKAKLLLECIRLVLERGLRNLGTSLGTGAANYYSVSGRSGRNQDELKVFRRTGSPCPRCATPIKRILLAQRSTHFCPNCQKR